jgi:hypothetical protein
MLNKNGRILFKFQLREASTKTNHYSISRLTLPAAFSWVWCCREPPAAWTSSSARSERWEPSTRWASRQVGPLLSSTLCWNKAMSSFYSKFIPNFQVSVSMLFSENEQFHNWKFSKHFDNWLFVSLIDLMLLGWNSHFITLKDSRDLLEIKHFLGIIKIICIFENWLLKTF